MKYILTSIMVAAVLIGCTTTIMRPDTDVLAPPTRLHIHETTEPMSEADKILRKHGWIPYSDDLVQGRVDRWCCYGESGAVTLHTSRGKCFRLWDKDGKMWFKQLPCPKTLYQEPWKEGKDREYQL